MLSSAIHAERDRLDHQRWRIEEILQNQSISAEMEQHLRHRLAYITQRLAELDLPAAAGSSESRVWAAAAR